MVQVQELVMRLVVLEQVMKVDIVHQKEILVVHLIHLAHKQVVAVVELEQQDKMLKVVLKLVMVVQV